MIGVIVDPTFPPTNVQVAELKVAAAAQGLQIRIFNASSDSELEFAFAALGDAGVGAVALVGNPFFNSRRNQIVALSARHAMPSIFEIRQFVEAGGLISYGPSIGEVLHQVTDCRESPIRSLSEAQRTCREIVGASIRRF